MGKRARRVILLSAGLGLMAAAFQATPPSSGLVVWWTLDDAVTTDASGSGNTGTVAGGPTGQAADKPALNFTNVQSMSFDGTDDQVTRAAVTGLAPGNTPHTIALWLKINAFPATRAWIALLGNPDVGAHHWLIDSTGATQFGTWGPFAGSVQKNPVLPADGQWRHVAAVFDGTTYEIYINGAAMGGGPVASAFGLQGVPFAVAQKQVSESNFPGLLDDIRLYSRALTLAEVQYLAAGNGPPAAPANFQAQGVIGGVNLSWNTVSGAAGYVVRSGPSGGPYSTVVFSGPGTSATDSTGTPGVPSFYVVTAFHSAGGESANSTQASASPLAVPPPPPRTAPVGNEDDRCGCGAVGPGSPSWLLALLPALALLALGARRR